MKINRESLAQLDCDELRTIAKKLGVQRYTSHKRLKKEELIASILRREMALEYIRSRNMAQDSIDKKMKYLNTVEIGTLLAFACNGGAKSAKIVNRNAADKALEVETEYGQRYTIDYKDVLWVKTGARWPKGIYNLLKYGTENKE